MNFFKDKEKPKFRGWDDLCQCWRYGYYTKLFQGPDLIHVIMVEEFGGLTSIQIHDPEKIFLCSGIKEGFEDGKEIYEGDIFLNGESPRVIVFRGGNFKAVTFDGKQTILLSFIVNEKNRIIGNIVENQEMLK